MLLKDKIRKIRTELKLDRQEFAELIGTNYKRIQNIENNTIKSLKSDEIDVLVGLGYDRLWLMSSKFDVVKEDKITRIVINDELIYDIILLLENWLTDNNLTLSPTKKVKAIKSLNQLLTNTSNDLNKTDDVKEYLLPYIYKSVSTTS